MARRLSAFVIGVLALSWVGHPPARAAGPEAPAAGAPAGTPVEVETTDGKKVEGTVTGTVRVKSHLGTLDLDPPQLDQLTVEPGEGGKRPSAAVVAHDHSTFTGELLSDELTVTVGGEARTFPVRDLRVVTFKHPQDKSLAGIIVGLFTLALMEIVLGVDNIIFLAIVAGKLPQEQQRTARRIGLVAALGTRILLLLTLSWLLGLTRPVFTLPDLPMFHTHEARGVSWRDIILLVGGMFLIGKSVFEMHEKLEHAQAAAAGGPSAGRKAAGFASVIAQIAVIDIIFSLDSVITAVGMVDEVWVMITAMVIAVGVMIVAAEPISRFVDDHPTIKVLALSFLILIGVLLVAEGLGQHMNKGYIYFAMAFGVGVELVNMRLRGSPTPVAQELPAAPAA